MKTIILTLIFIATLCDTTNAKQHPIKATSQANIIQNCAITYKIHIGWDSRFGDHIVTYCKTKWLSYKYNLKLLYNNFPYADELMLSKFEEILTDKVAKKFKKATLISSEADLIKKLSTVKQPTLFYVSIFTVLNEQTKLNRTAENSAWVNSFLFEIMINNHDFGKKLKYLLQPINKTDQVKLPENLTTVAVHIRKRSNEEPFVMAQPFYEEIEKNSTPYVEKLLYEKTGHFCEPIFDPTQESTNTDDNNNFINDNSNHKEACLYVDQVHPHKFPPEQYYVEQIIKLSEMFKDSPLYVHIFSDVSEISNLVERIKQKINKPNITFGFNTQATTGIQDCFSMAKFDCLIRSYSHFSWVSQMIGNHKIVFYPIHYKWINPQILIMDKVAIILNNKKGQVI